MADEEQQPETRRTRKLRRLKYSCEEVYDRMENGLCLFCEEFDTPGHHQLKHKGIQIFMTECDDDQVSEDKTVTNPEPFVETVKKSGPFIEPLKRASILQDSIDLNQEGDHAKTVVAEKLNLPLGNFVEQVVGLHEASRESGKSETPVTNQTKLPDTNPEIHVKRIYHKARKKNPATITKALTCYDSRYVKETKQPCFTILLMDPRNRVPKYLNGVPSLVDKAYTKGKQPLDHGRASAVWDRGGLLRELNHYYDYELGIDRELRKLLSKHNTHKARAWKLRMCNYATKVRARVVLTQTGDGKRLCSPSFLLGFRITSHDLLCTRMDKTMTQTIRVGNEGKSPLNCGRANHGWKPGESLCVHDEWDWISEVHSRDSVMKLTQLFHGKRLQGISTMDRKLREVIVDNVLTVMVCLSVHNRKLEAELDIYISVHHYSRNQKLLKEFSWFKKLNETCCFLMEFLFVELVRYKAHYEMPMLPCLQQFGLGLKMGICVVLGWQEFKSIWWVGYNKAMRGTSAKQELPNRSVAKYVKRDAHEEETLGVLTTYEVAEIFEKLTKSWKFKFKSKYEKNQLSGDKFIFAKKSWEEAAIPREESQTGFLLSRDTLFISQEVMAVMFKDTFEFRSCMITVMKFHNYQLFETMLMQVQSQEKRRKYHKTWKFKYKQILLLRVLPQNEQHKLMGRRIIKCKRRVMQNSWDMGQFVFAELRTWLLCEMRIVHDLGNLRQLTHAGTKFHLKHKWRSRLLQSFSRLELITSPVKITNSVWEQEADMDITSAIYTLLFVQPTTTSSQMKDTYWETEQDNIQNVIYVLADLEKNRVAVVPTKFRSELCKKAGREVNDLRGVLKLKFICLLDDMNWTRQKAWPRILPRFHRGAFSFSSLRTMMCSTGEYCDRMLYHQICYKTCNRS